MNNYQKNDALGNSPTATHINQLKIWNSTIQIGENPMTATSTHKHQITRDLQLTTDRLQMIARNYTPLMKLLAQWARPGRANSGSGNHAEKYSSKSA